MRLLILSQYYPPEIGAPQVRLSAMARHLQALGHEVEVVTAMPNHPTGKIFPHYRGRLYTLEQVDGIPVHRVWMYAATGAGVRRILNYVTFAITAVWGLSKSRRPDYIFVESPPLFLSIPGAIAARLWGAKVIFNVADLWPDSVRELGLIKDGWVLHLAERLERWSYRVAYKVNAVTQGIWHVLVQDKGISQDRVVFLPNGVDADMFCPRDANLRLVAQLGLNGKRVVLYAGTLGFAQGLDTVLEAAALLHDRQDICFVFIGDGSDKQRLVDVATSRGLTNVKFLPPAPPSYVAELYNLAFAGLAVLKDLPLFRGARPSKVFPCMASGVPVLYSGAGEGASLVEQAGAGIVVPPEDGRSLADAVRCLADDEDRATNMGRSGRNFVIANLSWTALINQWLRDLET